MDIQYRSKYRLRTPAGVIRAGAVLTDDQVKALQAVSASAIDSMLAAGELKVVAANEEAERLLQATDPAEVLGAFGAGEVALVAKFRVRLRAGHAHPGQRLTAEQVAELGAVSTSAVVDMIARGDLIPVPADAGEDTTREAGPKGGNAGGRQPGAGSPTGTGGGAGGSEPNPDGARAQSKAGDNDPLPPAPGRRGYAYPADLFGDNGLPVTELPEDVAAPLLQAVAELDASADALWTADGKPQAKALTDAVGRTVSADERDALVDALAQWLGGDNADSTTTDDA